MTTFTAEIPSPYGLLSVTEKDSAIIDSGDGGVERNIELLKLEGGFPYLL